LGLDTTNERFKIGDGVNGWNALDNAQYTNKAETFTETLTLAGSDNTSDWSQESGGDWDGIWTVTKTVTGILTTDTPLIEIDLSNATALTYESLNSNYASIFRVEVSAINQLKFYASAEPAPDLPILIKVVR
jgi:hypothetical protein